MIVGCHGWRVRTAVTMKTTGAGTTTPRPHLSQGVMNSSGNVLYGETVAMGSFKRRLSEAWREGDDEGVEWLNKEREMALRGPQSLYIQRLDPEAMLPTRGSVGSAGLDLYSLREQFVLPRHQQNIRTGIAMDIPDGMVGMIWPRSGLAAKHMIDVMAGVVDSDYTGEIIVILRNHNDTPFKVRKGERVAQMIIQGYNKLKPVEVDGMPSKGSRGESGFGSTGEF